LVPSSRVNKSRRAQISSTSWQRPEITNSKHIFGKKEERQTDRRNTEHRQFKKHTNDNMNTCSYIVKYMLL
jgi:hypothetical protein